MYICFKSTINLPQVSQPQSTVGAACTTATQLCRVLATTKQTCLLCHTADVSAVRRETVKTWPIATLGLRNLHLEVAAKRS